jgi:phenol/toluene 2-monooxygenase (NADH) P1/A1
VIEPQRQTFTSLINRYGGRPATRYEEGSVDIQATENFHYRPLWDPAHELYDVEYSALRLADPYSFLDPRQFYYAPYVTSRAQLHDAFGKTLDYLVQRDLIGRLPEAWHTFFADLLLPLRHYESGGQLISVNGARFAYGTTIEQCLSYAAFDRIGNAQMLSKVGIALGDNSDALLGPAKTAWLDAPELQGLRRFIEELLVERDWAVGAFALDLCDQLLFPLLTRHLDEAALTGGAGAYSLLMQHFGTWFTDQRKWLDALVACWLKDPEYAASNAAALSAAAERWLPQAVAAVTEYAKATDVLLGVDAEASVATTAVAIRQRLAEIGIEVSK